MCANGWATLRHALLRLHKVLLDGERVSFDQVHGRILSSGDLLQLVTGDPWFAWLRPLSEFIVQIDERLDTDASRRRLTFRIRHER